MASGGIVPDALGYDGLSRAEGPRQRAAQGLGRRAGGVRGKPKLDRKGCYIDGHNGAFAPDLARRLSGLKPFDGLAGLDPCAEIGGLIHNGQADKLRLMDSPLASLPLVPDGAEFGATGP